MRRLTPVLAFLILVSLPLAGCLGSPDGPSDGGPAAANDTDPADAPGGTGATPSDLEPSTRVAAPTWQAGDWFEYDRSGPWTVEGTSRLVVVEATGEGYVTGLTDEAQQARDIFWSNDPLLGPLSPDLAPRLDDTPARAPQVVTWPLSDGALWEATGYEETWSFQATFDDAVETPVGTHPGYRIAGSAANSSIAATYVPALATLTSFVVRWDGDDVSYAYELVDRGTGHEGPVWTASRTVLVQNRAWRTPDLVPPVVEIDVPGDQTDLYAYLFHGGAAGSAASLHDPGGTQRYASASPAAQGGVEDVIRLEDPASGTWRWVFATVGSATDPASCGPDAPLFLLCGVVYLRMASLVMEEVQVGG